MKIRHLPPTDLARIAPLPTDEKVVHLRRFKFGAPPFTYKPVRDAVPDLLDASGSLFESTGKTPLAEIESRIRRAKISPDGVEQNLQVARALYYAAKAEKIVSVQYAFYAMSIGMIDQIRLWSDLYLLMDGKPSIVFFDTRRGNKLSDLGRRFAFSMQHEHIRQQNEDFADAALSIFQFGTEDGSRNAKIVMHGDGPLYSHDQLEAMIRETYRLWIEISEERVEETRRRASGSGGGLI